MSFSNSVMYFLVYSFFGWVMESIYKSIKNGQFVNSGFLKGCFCPVYGFGAFIVVMTFRLVHTFGNHQLLTAILGAILSMFFVTFLEYSGGALLYRLAGRRYWDYSRERFNIHGYVCLKCSIFWGVLSLVVAKVLHPAIIGLFSFLPSVSVLFISIAYLLYFIFDFAFTCHTIKICHTVGT